VAKARSAAPTEAGSGVVTAGGSSRPASSKTPAGDTVLVGLNDPHGIAFIMPGGRKVIVNGNAVDLRGKEKGELPIGGYGLTRISSEDWEWINKNYGGMAVFKAGLIFAADSRDEFEDLKEERESLRHGYEPVDLEG
jgi:hypothetical protein